MVSVDAIAQVVAFDVLAQQFEGRGVRLIGDRMCEAEIRYGGQAVHTEVGTYLEKCRAVMVVSVLAQRVEGRAHEERIPVTAGVHRSCDREIGGRDQDVEPG